jgi:hypothetical protein
MRAVIGAAVFVLVASGAVAAPIEVHPIVVCDDSGASCAVDPTGSAYNNLINANVLSAVYAQTKGTDYTGTSFPGVTFTLDRPSVYNSSAFLNVVADQTTGVGGSVSSNPLDSAHLLIRGSGHAQSTNPDALNVYIVNSITATQNLTTTLGPLSGWGLTSANGAVIANTANIDTLAHELGHNLGLTHVDGKPGDSPDNLMRSVGRTLPTSVNDPAIGTTIDLLSGAQGNDQIAQANAPLFTVDLASGVVGGGYTDCHPGSLNCVLELAYNGSNTAASITGIKLRWTDPHALDETVIDTPIHGVVGLPSSLNDALGCGDTPVTTHTIQGSSGAGLELDLSLPPGCLTAGSSTSLAFEFPGDSLGGPPGSGYYQTPFSAEFDFAGGKATSLALFDATTGMASTPDTVTVGARTPPTNDEFEETVAVPEPGAAALLLPGLCFGLCWSVGRQLRVRRIA